MTRYIIAHDLRTKRSKFTCSGVMKKYKVSKKTFDRVRQMLGKEVQVVSMPHTEAEYEWKGLK